MIRFKRRPAQRAEKKKKLTEAEERAKRREYARNYYQTHREKLIENQKRYNNQRNVSQRNRYTLKHSATNKQAERPAIVDTHNPSTLMQSSPEKLERAIKRIVTGKADFVGAR